MIDLDATNALLTKTLTALRTIAARHGDQLKTELGATGEKDQRVVDELFEEDLDRRLREDDKFHRISDELMDDNELRFSLLADGAVQQPLPALRAPADTAGERRSRGGCLPAGMEP
ncbi:MAG: hypothetical protein WA210_24130 [Burkholderiaceae bacterium]